MRRPSTDPVHVAARGLRPRRTGLVLAAAALVVSVAGPLGALRPAAADKLADKKAQAARLAQQIQANDDRISQLDEAFNAANLRIATLQRSSGGDSFGGGTI